MQAEGIIDVDMFLFLEFKDDFIRIGTDKRIEFIHQQALNILWVRDVGGGTARLAGKGIEEDIIPITANTHAADANVLGGGLLGELQAVLFVAIGMSICKQDDMVDARGVDGATYFLISRFQTVDRFRWRPMGKSSGCGLPVSFCRH